MRPFANTILIFLACQFVCIVLFGQVPTLKGRIVIFNKPPSVESVSDAGNYEIIYREKKMVITKVRTGNTLEGEPANSIYLYVHTYLFPKNSDDTKGFAIKFKDMYDTDGMLLNEVHYIPVNQFREIFVQKATDASLPASDSIYVKRDQPLSDSPKANSSTEDKANFWMNTPLRPAPEKPFVEVDLVEENK